MKGNQQHMGGKCVAHGDMSAVNTGSVSEHVRGSTTYSAAASSLLSPQNSRASIWYGLGKGQPKRLCIEKPCANGGTAKDVWTYETTLRQCCFDMVGKSLLCLGGGGDSPRQQ